ncbi:hypothetical protein VTN77DRAFT_8371 [Rasamsonia byssochlamydoides]|uniref:uncharacterized protein n=1 Tax=Rasamsonia byssochlamydoides TaxID=89139 RepID=UPI003744259B
MSQSLLDLPNELLQLIAKHLDSQRDINAFSRTNRLLYRLVNPLLYQHNIRNFGSPALLWAAKHGREATVHHFLREGAAVQPPCSSAPSYTTPGALRVWVVGHSLEFNEQLISSPLSYAALNGHEALVKLFLEKGVDPNFSEHHHHTPLSLAAMNGHVSIIKLLLDAGADLNWVTRHDGTPLACAARKGQAAAAEFLLLEVKKRAAMRDSWFQRQVQGAAIAAIRNGHETVVKLFLEKEPDAVFHGPEYPPPLKIAAIKGNVAIVKLLLDGDIDLDVNGHNAVESLGMAARYGHKAVVELFLEKGVDPQSRNDGFRNRTALSQAAEGGHEAVVELLLAQGVDPECRDGDGRTPLYWATLCRHEKVVALLQSHIKSTI